MNHTKAKKTVSFSRLELLNDLKELKSIAELPRLYLADYFQNLRDNVNIEFAPKQIELQNDNEKKTELDELNKLWGIIIEKIYAFEKNTTKKRYNLEAIEKRIEDLESNLNNNNKAIDLEEMKEKIEDEKSDLLQVLFQNKTIIFVNGTDYFQRTKRTRETREKLIEKSLIIIGDEFICEKSLIER